MTLAALICSPTAGIDQQRVRACYRRDLIIVLINRISLLVSDLMGVAGLSQKSLKRLDELELSRSGAGHEHNYSVMSTDSFPADQRQSC